MTDTEGVEAPRTWSRLHLIWAVSISLILGAIGFLIGLFGWCGDDYYGCTGDAASTVASIGPGILLLLLVAGAIYGLMRVAPWSASAVVRSRVAWMAAGGYLLLVLAYLLITGLWPRP